MSKADIFSKVLDLLNDEEKDKLMISAQGLIRAQKVVKVGLPKDINTQKKRKLCMKK